MTDATQAALEHGKDERSSNGRELSPHRERLQHDRERLLMVDETCGLVASAADMMKTSGSQPNESASSTASE